jgi:hypothetical protein
MFYNILNINVLHYTVQGPSTLSVLCHQIIQLQLQSISTVEVKAKIQIYILLPIYEKWELQKEKRSVVK